MDQIARINLPVESDRDYLVRRRFPAEALTLRRERIGEKMAPEAKLRVRTYRKELDAKSNEEISRLVEEEKAKERQEAVEALEEQERLRFYNRPSALADYEHWSKATYWSVEEAVALLFGRDPSSVSWEKIKSHEDLSSFVREYRKLRDLARRATASGLLQDPGVPDLFLKWAKRIDHTIPEDLIAACDRFGYLAVDWYEQYNSLKEQYDALESSTQTVAPASQEQPNQSHESLSVYWEELGLRIRSAVAEFPEWSKSVRKVQKSGNLNDWLKQKFDLNNREAYIAQKVLTERYDQLK